MKPNRVRWNKLLKVAAVMLPVMLIGSALQPSAFGTTASLDEHSNRGIYQEYKSGKPERPTVGNGSERSAGVIEIEVPAEIKSGNMIEIKLNVDDATDLFAVQAVLNYDPNVFEFKSVKPAKQFREGSKGGFFAEDHSIPGQTQILASQLQGSSLNGDVEVALITLKAKKLDKSRATQITLDKQSLTAHPDADESGVTYPLAQNQVQQVTVTVKSKGGK